MVDKTIELEVALRDSVSQSLKQIADNLEAVNEKLTRGSDEIKGSSDSIQKVAKHTRDLGESAKQTSRHLMGLGDSIIKLAGVAGGPIALGAGVVAGAFALGNKLKEFSNERMKLRAMSENGVFTEDDISIMQRTQRRMGLTKDQADANIERISSKMEGMLIYGKSSEMFIQLADMGLSKFGRELVQEIQSGNISKAFKMILSEYEKIRNQFGEAAAAHYATVVGLDQSFLQRYEKASQGVVPAFRMSIEAAEDWGERWEIIHHNLHNMWVWTVGNMIWGIARAEEGVGKAAQTAGQMPMPIVGAEGAQPAPNVTKPAGQSEAEQASKEIEETKKEANKLFNDIKDILQRMITKDRNLIKRQEGGPVIAGRDYLVGEQGPELFGSGGKFALLGEGGPEIFRPKTTGTITKADVTRDMQKAYAIGETVAREFEPKGLGDPASIAADTFAGPMKRALHVLKRFENDPEVRSTLRSFGKYIPQSVKDLIGVKPVEDDPNEPAPWLPGGEFDKLRADMDQFGREGVTLSGGIEFRNVPPGVRTDTNHDGFDDFTVNKSRSFAGAY